MKSIQILSIDENYCDKIQHIILRNKLGGQVVRAFIIEVNEINDGFLKEKLKAPLLNLIRLEVNPDYRRMGWATLVINRLIDNSLGKQIIVNAYPDNENYMSKDELMKFYMKFGFKVLGPSKEGNLMFLEK